MTTRLSKLLRLLLLTAAFVAPANAFQDPSLGRWINRDPIGEQGGNNLYAFAENKPTQVVDRFGLHVYVVCDGVGLVPHYYVVGDDGNGGGYRTEFGPGRGGLNPLIGPGKVSTGSGPKLSPFELTGPGDTVCRTVYTDSGTDKKLCSYANTIAGGGYYFFCIGPNCYSFAHDFADKSFIQTPKLGDQYFVPPSNIKINIPLMRR